MAKKIVVNFTGSLTNEALASKKQSVADALGVCAEDVILLPGLSVSVVELPDELTAARAKADKEAAAKVEKAKKDAEAAELEAVKAQQAAAAKATGSSAPAVPPAPPDYDKKAAKA